MIRAIKYCYWYIMAMIACILSRKERTGTMRWQYYCWKTASMKSKPKVMKGESDNDDQGSGE